MNVMTITKTVRDAIAASASFLALADTTVFEDYGNMKTQKEAALDVTSAPPGPGYDVAIWPPARGNGADEMSGVTQTDCAVIVRFEVNPAGLPATPADARVWVTTRLQEIINAVLAIPRENNGTRFQLAADAFELVNFDAGLLAYHIRFARPVTFGI